MTLLSRRTFLRALGIGTGVAVVAPELLVPEPEPVRRYWQVGRNAPVGLHQPVQLVDTGKLEPLPLWLDDSHGYTYDPTDALHFGDETALGDAQIKALLERRFIRTRDGAFEAKMARMHRAYYGDPAEAEARHQQHLKAYREELAALYPEPDPAAPFRMTVLRPRDWDSLSIAEMLDAMPGAEDA